ncbi:MAG TPA: hypothetical protein VFM97_09550 [Gammaproteobacteria bacterium]|nr:hypothetical protein [Gammaproteobacteria bacterium]
MADDNIELKIRIEAIQEGLANIEKTTSEIRRLAATAQRPLPDNTKHFREGIRRTHESLISTVKMLGQFYLVYEGLSLIAHGIEAAIASGIEFNSTMETSRIGIASLIVAQGKLTDAQGNVLKGNEALNAAMQISEAQVQKLKIAGIQTSATFEQLAQTFQQSVGPGLAAGLNLDQIRQFTITAVQAAGALGVPMNQLSQEVRSILSGEIDMNSRVAKALGITNAMVKQWKQQGVLFDKLNEKMGAFAVAGERVSHTWVAVKSNIADAMSNIAGIAEKPLFDDLEASMNQALGQIFDTAHGKISDTLTGFVDGLQSVAAAVGNMLGNAIAGIVRGMQTLSGFISRNAGALADLGTAFGSIWTQTKGVLAYIGGIIAAVIKWSVQAGYVQGIFEVIAVAIAGLRDGITLLGAGVAWLGGKIIQFLATPIQVVLEKFAALLRLIPGMKGMANAIQGYADNLQKMAAASQAYAEKTFAEFANGKTHVQDVLATFAKLDSQIGQTKTHATAAASGIQQFLASLTTTATGDPKQLAKINAIKLKAQTQHALAGLALTRETLAQKLALGEISGAEELRRLADLENKKYAIARKSLQDLLALEKVDAAKRAKLKAKLQQLEDQHALKTRQLNDRTTQAVAKTWESRFNVATNAIQQSINGVIQGTQTWRQATANLLNSIVAEGISAGLKMLAHWGAVEIAKTTATATGAASRTAIRTGEAATETGLTIGTAIKSILAHAWEAASAVYASIAAIPGVGPFLAPAMAIAAGATVAGYVGRIASAANGYDIPAGVNPIVQTHEEEMILPADLSNKVRNMTDGGGAQIHIHAVDAKSVKRLFMDHPDALAEAVLHARRRGAFA